MASHHWSLSPDPSLWHPVRISPPCYRRIQRSHRFLSSATSTRLWQGYHEYCSSSTARICEAYYGKMCSPAAHPEFEFGESNSCRESNSKASKVIEVKCLIRRCTLIRLWELQPQRNSIGTCQRGLNECLSSSKQHQRKVRQTSRSSTIARLALVFVHIDETIKSCGTDHCLAVVARLPVFLLNWMNREQVLSSTIVGRQALPYPISVAYIHLFRQYVTDIMRV